MRKIFLFSFFIAVCCSAVYSQQPIAAEDKLALEGVIVEKYYVADSTNNDTTAEALAKGSVTYRIYIDMKPGYTLQLVYGNAQHELNLATTTTFYNNQDCGAIVGYNVDYKKISQGNYAFDSWITLNSATNRHAGILKADDIDGSIISQKGFEKADGFINGNLPVFKPFNIDLSFFQGAKSAVFSTKNGGWAGISGIKSGTVGPTPDNRVLIAQLTTNGKLSFELNVQIGTPTGGVIKYVAQNPEGDEIKLNSLLYK